MDPMTNPPFEVVRAAHPELVVTDLGESRHFYVDLLGFVPTEETSDALYLRGYEDRVHHSLVLRRGPRPAIGHLAFRLASPEDVERAADHYTRLGCPTRWLEPGEEAGQARALRVQDPLGFQVELFHEIAGAECLLQRFDLYRGAHVMRFDHFNLHVPDVQTGFDYYRSLGFRCSELTVTESPDEQLWAAWLFRKPTVHDVALTNGHGPRLHHLGFWVPEAHDVLRACDVLAAAGYAGAIERGPGRHGISNAFFLYLRDPDGHRVELYTGDYYTGDPDLEPIRWSLGDPARQTFWGHPAPASWFEQSSRIDGLDGELVPLAPPLLTALPAPAH